MTDSVTLFPAWKQAVEDAAVEFDYGDVVTREWLIDKFALEPPEYCTPQEHQDYQFRFLEAVDSFRTHLLEEHNMALETIRGRGYRVLKPDEQTGYTMKQFHAAVSREVRKAAMRLHYIASEMLTEEEQRQNMDARGKVAAIHSFTRKQIQTDSPKKKRIAKS